MGNQEADQNHCYECGSEEVHYRSLLPLAPNFVEREKGGPDDGKVINARGFSADYNVCAPCYVVQYHELYPGEEVPARVLATAGGE